MINEEEFYGQDDELMEDEPDGPIMGLDDDEPAAPEPPAAPEHSAPPDNDLRLEIARANETAAMLAAQSQHGQAATAEALRSVVESINAMRSQQASGPRQSAPAQPQLSLEEQKELLETMGPDKYVAQKVLPWLAAIQKQSQDYATGQIERMREEFRNQSLQSASLHSKNYIQGELDRAHSELDKRLDELPLPESEKKNIRDEFDAELDTNDAAHRYFIVDPTTRMVVGSRLDDLIDRAIGRRSGILAKSATDSQIQARTKKRQNTFNMSPAGVGSNLSRGSLNRPLSFEEELYLSRVQDSQKRR